MKQKETILRTLTTETPLVDSMLDEQGLPDDLLNIIEETESYKLVIEECLCGRPSHRRIKKVKIN